MKKSGLLYDLHEKPPVWKWIILALQHVFAMFGATILVPILVNTMAGDVVLSIPVALVTSGIGTIIYIICTKAKSPVYLGSSFAFIAPIAVGYMKAGISGAMTGVMIAGLIYIAFAILISFIGKGWIDKILPPLVIGPMIMIIGLGLAPAAISSIGIGSDITNIDWKGVFVALVTFLTTAIVMLKGKGFLKIVPFLVGIVVGYIVAVVLKMIDFTPIMQTSFFSMPDFVIPFLTYKINFGAALTIAPIAIVTIAEHIGDHTVLSAIVKRDLLKEPGLNRTLLGDGIATFVAGALGGPANTTYGENTSVVGMTKVASIWVIFLAAVFAILLGFLGKFTALASTIPNAVLGGVSLILYGFIAVNGLKVLIEKQVDFSKSKNVIVASTMLVLGLGGAALSVIFGEFSMTISGMSLAAISGILLNVFLPEEKEEDVIEEEIISREDVKKDIVILDHPLIEHKVAILRDKNTGTKEFRELVGEIGMFLCYEAMKDAKLNDTEIETPMEKMKTKKLDEDKYAFLPILRAGTGMLDGLVKVIPNAKIGHIGMYRNEETLTPVRYFYKAPKDIENREVLILDPMLATGGSACDTIEQIKKDGVKKIKFLCLIAAPEGVKKIQDEHPDVQIFCAALDEKLNEVGYIIPGLGDAGDRIFGTK